MRLRFVCLIVLTFLNLAGAIGLSASQLTSLAVTFSESAPKDSFTIVNVGTCKLGNLQFRLNLASSQGRLIFDPTASGAGVEVFQPLEITAGQSAIEEISEVRDGSQGLTIKLRNLLPGAKVAFTVDVDDTLPREKSQLGQIRVSGAEIAGAKVYGEHSSGAESAASFGDDVTVRLDRLPCA